MKINGIIIQRRAERLYQGVEGDNWYLNYCSYKELDKFFKENIEKAWEDNNYVDVCNDIEFVKKYIDISLYEKINYKILACITEKELPQMVLEAEDDMKFLGYDYAYSGGSYYSAVLNDVIAKRIPQFFGIQLNKYGLFDTCEEINDFINIRKSLKNTEEMKTEYLEEGDFIIYKLYEVKYLNNV